METDGTGGGLRRLVTRSALRQVRCLVVAPCAVLMALMPVWAQPDELETAKQLDAQAKQLHEAGQYAKAIPFAQRALAIREQVLGPEHLATASSLRSLAEPYRGTDTYSNGNAYSSVAAT